MMQEKESGRILQCIGGIYTVATDSGTVSCKARGVFRKRGMTPYAGDFVTVHNGGGGKRAIQYVYTQAAQELFCFQCKNMRVELSYISVFFLFLYGAALNPYFGVICLGPVFY